MDSVREARQAVLNLLLDDDVDLDPEDRDELHGTLGMLDEYLSE